MVFPEIRNQKRPSNQLQNMLLILWLFKITAFGRPTCTTSATDLNELELMRNKILPGNKIYKYCKTHRIILLSNGELLTTLSSKMRSWVRDSHCQSCTFSHGHKDYKQTPANKRFLLWGYVWKWNAITSHHENSILTKIYSPF